MNVEWMVWVLIGLGCVPWLVQRTVTARRGHRRVDVVWDVRALFWSLTIRRQRRGGTSWRFTAPLIRRLSDAVWAALRKLIE